MNISEIAAQMQEKAFGEIDRIMLEAMIRYNVEPEELKIRGRMERERHPGGEVRVYIDDNLVLSYEMIVDPKRYGFKMVIRDHMKGDGKQ